MVDDSAMLDSNWREKVKILGKRGFENEEMLRLGFIDQAALERLAASGVTKAQYDEATESVRNLRRELKDLERQISSLQDVERAIAVIRSRRIERVRAEREARKARREQELITRRAEESRRKREEPIFFGRGVSNRVKFTGCETERLTALGIPQLETFMELSAALSLEPEQLQWLVYERGASTVDHYTRFEIPKRSGGSRLISSPKPALRAAQEWVRNSILARLPVHSAAMAFRPGISIVDNARAHSDSRVVVRIDLKDFFPSITFPRVRGYFESLGYNSGISTVFALLCTDSPRVQLNVDGVRSIVSVGQRGLPQGACTSPDLANLIAGHLDRRLAGLVTRTGWTYTRYADDLVFSSNEVEASPHRLLRAVTNIAGDEGFTVNEEKTRIMRSPNRQAVTGLVVNEGVRMSRRDLRRIRAFLHQCETQGIEAVSQRIGKSAQAVARGHYAYIDMVSPAAAARVREKHPWI